MTSDIIVTVLEHIGSSPILGVSHVGGAAVRDIFCKPEPTIGLRIVQNTGIKTGVKTLLHLVLDYMKHISDEIGQFS